MNEKWLKQYKENYDGKSTEAKSVADYTKENYKGNTYIPWATMERLTYMQDPSAKFEKIRNEQGGLVHTDSFINENLVEDKNGIVSRTSALVVSHFVKVSCTFLGKEFIEEYPIQEQDYTAAKIYNQNLVNKALQRALAKVASRATGIGLRLYENKDLQYEEDKEEKKPEVKKTTKTTKKVEEPKVLGDVIEVDGHTALGFAYPANQTEEETVTGETVKMTYTPTPVEPVKEELEVISPEAEPVLTSYSQEVIDLCRLIKNADTEKMNKVLQNINVSILKQHGFILKQDDSEEELCEKLNHFTSVEVFTKAIKTMLGD